METVDVHALWDPDGYTRPLRFTWHGREWTVHSTGRRWKDDGGEHILCMTPEKMVFELVYHPMQEQWFMGFHNDTNPLV